MELATVIELVQTLGFPVACVVVLGLFIWRIYKKSEEREATLMNEIKENRDINAKAIETIAQYAEKLDIIQKDISDIKTDITILTGK